MRSRGFHLNLSKCELCWPEAPLENVRSSYPEVLIQLYTDGTLVFNAPVGSKGFCDASFTAKVRSLEPPLDDVTALENPQVSITLLKCCLGVSKINYLLRVTQADSTMMEDQVVQFREKFVNQNLGRTRGTERGSVAPSPIRPIYARKVKRGPLSVLAAELRSFLPGQCVRGLLFYGKDCLEMLVEESMEQFAINILSYLGVAYKLNT